MDASAVEKNGLGSAALALALVGLGFIGIFFGIRGLKEVKAGRANNQAVALWGTILSGVGIVVVPLLIVLRLTTDLLAPSVPPDELAIGTCIQAKGLSDGSEVGDVLTVKTASCARGHYGEVYYQGTLTTTGQPIWGSLDDDVYDQCIAHIPNGVSSALDLYIQYFFPSPDTWREGDRAYTCALVSPDEPLVGHLWGTP